MNAFFLRAESFFNVATAVEDLRVEQLYERPLHEQSHGESFLSLVLQRFGPAASTSSTSRRPRSRVHGQLAFLRRMHEFVGHESQFVIATHSPILLGYPTRGSSSSATRHRANRVRGDRAVPADEGLPRRPRRFFRHLLDERVRSVWVTSERRP